MGLRSVTVLVLSLLHALCSHGTDKHMDAERKTADDDAPPNFKLSTNAIKGKFSMLNGLFDSQGGVGTGVGCMYTTLSKETLKAEKAKRSQQVSENPFKPANPTKKSGGNLGTHYGAVNYR